MKFIVPVICSAFFFIGCAKKEEIPPPSIPKKNPSIYVNYDERLLDSSDNSDELAKIDRYTIVELDSFKNNYVLDQIINISIPKNITFTVGDGMRYVLKQTGYELCNNSLVDNLYSKLLPIIQYKMGPIRLGESLKIMSGPAWSLYVDDVQRSICFRLNDGYELTPREVEDAGSEIYYEEPIIDVSGS